MGIFKLPLAAMIIVLAFSVSLSAAKERPKKGSVTFGSKNPLASSLLVEAKKTSRAFIEVSRFVKPSVVSVSSTKIMKMQNAPFMGGPFDFFFGTPPQGEQQAPQQREFRQEGLGSGVIVSKEGYVITNNHVVKEADEIIVTLLDNKEVEAEVVGTDAEADVAVLKLKETVADLPVALLGNSDSLEVGEWVLAIGNPFSKQFSHTVTAGIVSAVGRNTGINVYENFIQTDASINPGNSGGALVNLQGEVIGINTAILSRSGGNVGIGFAIPINMAKKVMEDLLYEGKVSRGWLGIQMQELDKNLADALGLKDSRGVLVQKVLKDSPAEKGGVKAGDVVVAVDGRPVVDSKDLKNLIGNTAPGTSVSLKLFRDKKEKTVKIKLDERNPETVAEGRADSDDDLLGLSVKELGPELARQFGLDAGDKGVVVAGIAEKSAASFSDLREGDLIQAANGKSVENLSDYKKAIQAVKKGDSVLFYLKRGGNNLYVAVKIKDKEK